MRGRTIRCYICDRRLRKPRYVPLKYPEGTIELVPICKWRHRGVKSIELKAIQRAPDIPVYDIIMILHKR